MKQQSNRSAAEQLEDVIDQLGELYVRADALVDALVAEARERKLAQTGAGKQLN